MADSPENLKKQKTIYDTIMRKCGCKSSRCLTGRCSCKKNGSYCSSLCDCLNCENHTKETTQEISDPVEELEGPEEVLTSDSETEEIEEHDADADADDLDDL